MIKKILYFTILIFVFSCSNQKEETEIRNKEHKIPSEKLIKRLMKNYNDAAELLSIKHNISQKNSNIIIQEYIKIYDLILYRIVTGKKVENITEKYLNPDESLSAFISRMNHLTGEESVKISAFIIDLKSYME